MLNSACMLTQCALAHSVSLVQNEDFFGVE